MPGSPQWSPSLRFPHQNPVHTSHLPHMRYMPRPSHFITCSIQNYICCFFLSTVTCLLSCFHFI
jgi:hypothetical protein